MAMELGWPRWRLRSLSRTRHTGLYIHQILSGRCEHGAQHFRHPRVNSLWSISRYDQSSHQQNLNLNPLQTLCFRVIQPSRRLLRTVPKPRGQSSRIPNPCRSRAPHPIPLRSSGRSRRPPGGEKSPQETVWRHVFDGFLAKTKGNSPVTLSVIFGMGRGKQTELGSLFVHSKVLRNPVLSHQKRSSLDQASSPSHISMHLTNPSTRPTPQLFRNYTALLG